MTFGAIGKKGKEDGGGAGGRVDAEVGVDGGQFVQADVGVACSVTPDEGDVGIEEEGVLFDDTGGVVAKEVGEGALFDGVDDAGGGTIWAFSAKISSGEQGRQGVFSAKTVGAMFVLYRTLKKKA